jgi:hypothetical protein
MHPGLRISVYRVDPRTMKRTPIRAGTLPAADDVIFNMAFPPCECPRCRGTGNR